MLLDLWGKLDRPGAVFADITWMGYTGRAGARARIVEAFAGGPARARRGGRARAAARPRAGQELRGWRGRSRGVGRPARRRLRRRTSCTGPATASGESVHGNGVNMDDYETHDDRRLLPGTGFTIEPGVYFDDFGVRSEINMIVRRPRRAR